MEGDFQREEKEVANDLQRDGGAQQPGAGAFGGWVGIVACFSTAVTGQDADDEVDAEKRGEHAAGMDGGEIGDVVEHTTEDEVVG